MEAGSVRSAGFSGRFLPVKAERSCLPRNGAPQIPLPTGALQKEVNTTSLKRCINTAPVYLKIGGLTFEKKQDFYIVSKYIPPRLLLTTKRKMIILNGGSWQGITLALAKQSR